MSRIPELGPELPADLLARRSELPGKPEPVELVGPRVRLRPYVSSDGLGLHAISNGEPVTRFGVSVGAYDCEELIWRFIPAGPFRDGDACTAFHDWVADLPDARCFTLVDTSTGELLGSLSYLANDPANLKIEIGNVWYCPPVQGTGVNAEATLLLVDHAFALGYQRVEWKCHSDNHRSREAALRMGFVFEGIQEAHRIQKNRRRDTAWYRILATERAGNR